MDLPRSFTIREHSHRILNPFTEDHLATLGNAIRLRTGTSILDLCCGKGELLSTWARDHGITGTGVDISTVFLTAARARAAELNVSNHLTFLHADASTHVARRPVDVAACIGATWIGDGTAGTIALLERSLRPGGLILIGEIFWRTAAHPDPEAAAACHIGSSYEVDTLPGLVELFDRLGYDLVEMVLADEASWDRYTAAQWLNIRTFLDENPNDELAPELRSALNREPLDYVRFGRRLLGSGIFALMRR